MVKHNFSYSHFFCLFRKEAQATAIESLKGGNWETRAGAGRISNFEDAIAEVAAKKRKESQEHGFAGAGWQQRQRSAIGSGPSNSAQALT
jgi:hypothetical protein